MAKELEFDGFWEGMACYSCDYCGATVKIRFDSEDEAKDSRIHRKHLREDCGWITTKVNGNWKDFCSEAHRNKYIRAQTI